MDVETVIVGGGQAGLAVGFHLARRDRPFVILEAGARVGDSWRRRWDSMRLFTPARFDGLPGWRFPAPRWSFPTKDAMGDYLEGYAARFGLPVVTGARVEHMSRNGAGYLLRAGRRRFTARNVVVATGTYERPALPAFAGDLDPAITQVHSADYRNPGQLRAGGVLLVGAGNSGADIGLELARERRVWLSGAHPGQVPFRIESRRARVAIPVVFFAFRHVLTERTPPGRIMRAHVLAHRGLPLVRVKSADLAAAGVERVARTVAVRDGAPLLEDGRALDVANVVWCTGFRPDGGWIDLPGYDPAEPDHARGIVSSQPGLYLAGREFQYAASSAMIQGVGRDARHVARHIAARV